MGRPKKVPNPNETAYLWNGIPRELWLEARAKATKEQISMRKVLELLVRAWVTS